MDASSAGARVRIGELSRRSGVGVDTLRAWERRYGVFEPERSAGGFRLYGTRDLDRARSMRRLIDAGHAAAEAARAVLSEAPAVEAGVGVPSVEALCAALTALDEETATSLLDQAFSSLSLEALLRDLILPALREIGIRWERGEISVAEEHFASNLIRGRLLAMGRGWGTGTGPQAILACPPGELHDLGLIAFGLVLRGRGWRIAYLGQDTPLRTVSELAQRLGRPPVILAALEEARFDAVRDELEELAANTRLLAFGGAGGRPGLAEEVGASPLGDDLVAAAIALSDAA